jgi:hypothetical protein
VVLSAHGLGHAARASAVLERLADLVPIRLTVVAACDRRIWPPCLNRLTERWIAVSCDVGVLQSDDVTVDLAATRSAVGEWLCRLPAIVAREKARLEGAQDLVLSDVPAAAFPAAKAAGIRSVWLANFSWDWIYAELGMREAAAAAASCYADADLLLEGGPSAPMEAFRRRVAVGLIARRPAPRQPGLRDVLGVAESASLVLLAFQASSAPAIVLPPVRRDRVYLAPAGWPPSSSRPALRPLPDHVRFEEALASADVVVGKPGYGLIGDVEAAGIRFLFVPRPGFPENAVLERHLSGRAATVALAPRDLAEGRWEDTLAAVEASPAPAASPADGAEVAAAHLARLLEEVRRERGS